MRGDGRVAGEGRIVGVSFIPGVSAPLSPLTATPEAIFPLT